MRSERRDSREFLIGLLREANIVEEIIEDVVEACEMACYSAFSLASKSVTVPMLAEKLYLTQDEAESLKKVTLHRLCGEDVKINSKTSSMDAQASSESFCTARISYKIHPSCDNRRQYRHASNKSFISFEGLLDVRSANDRRTVLQSDDWRTVLSRGQWTDSTTDRDCLDESLTPKQPTKNTNKLVSEFRCKNNNKCSIAQKTEINILADVLSDKTHVVHHSRPYIPPLQLQDAGLSYGPPTSCHSPSSSLDTVSYPLIGDMSLSPVKPSVKKDASKAEKKQAKRVKKQESNKRREDVANRSSEKTLKIKELASSSLIPSYRRPTISSEAKRHQSARDREKTLTKSATGIQKTDHGSGKESGKELEPSKNPFSRSIKPTRAALVRMEFIRNRIEFASLGNQSPGKYSWTSRQRLHAKFNKIVSKSTTLLGS